MAIDLHALASNLNQLKNNWDNEGDLAGQVAEKYGGEALVNQVNENLQRTMDALEEAQNNLTRENLNKLKSSYDSAKQSASSYSKFKNAVGIYQGFNIAGALVDPETTAQVTGEILNPGNVAGSLGKYFIGSTIGLGGLASSALGEATGVDPVGYINNKIDQGAKIVGETAIAQGVETIARNTVGRGLSAVMNIPIGKDHVFEQWQTHDGKHLINNEGSYIPKNSVPDADGSYSSSTLYGYDAVKQYNKDQGVDFEPRSVPFEYKNEIGYRFKEVRDGVNDTKDAFSILNPWAQVEGEDKGMFERILDPRNLFAKMRKESGKHKSSIESQKEFDEYAKTHGLSSFDPSRMTSADHDVIRKEFEDLAQANIDDDKQRTALLDLLDHTMEAQSADPIMLKTYKIPGTGEVPMNANFEQVGGNWWGNVDPIKEGFFDDSGRPTQALFEYAKEFNRKIELYHPGEGSNYGSEAGMTPYHTLNPEKIEEFHGDAGMYFRGIEAPNLKSIDKSDVEYPGLNYFTDPSDENKFMFYDTEESDAWYTDSLGQIKYSGEIDLQADPSALGSGWYESDFFGSVYRPEESKWQFSQDDGWMYEDDDSDWSFREGAGWLYSYEDENQNKWLYGEDQDSWISYDKTKDTEFANWDWVNPKSSEPEVAKTYSDQEMKNAWIDDVWYNESDNLKGILYDMSVDGLNKAFASVTDGRTDREKFTKNLTASIPMFNANDVLQGISMGQTINQAYGKMNSTSLVPGSSQDNKSTMPQMETIDVQPQKPLYQPWVDKNFPAVDYT